MSSHVLPKVLKIGEYTLNKENFTLIHKNQRKDSTGRKRLIEYACDECETVFIIQLKQHMKSKHPFLCRSCRSKLFWQNKEYRDAIVTSWTPERHQAASIKFCEVNKLLWQNHRETMVFAMRNRNPSCYEKGRKSSRHSMMIRHWKTGVELCCTASYEVAFVNWCNANKIDFDWQIPHKMPDGRTYIIDAFIKTGEFMNVWIEIKGYHRKIGKEKWEWFHSVHQTTSELWDRQRLQELHII